MTKSPLRLILSNIRSAGNVGQIIRTADAAAVELIYACGYTPYPHINLDHRPPHISDANQRAIAKTALGSEITMPVLHFADTLSAIREAKSLGFRTIVVEQSENALNLFDYKPLPGHPLALVFGNEVDGVAKADIALADEVLELPMLGNKESLNVAAAAAITLYHLRFA